MLSYSCCVIHIDSTREFSHCETESQISKTLGAFLLSISKHMRSIGKPNTRMPVENRLKSGIQLI